MSAAELDEYDVVAACLTVKDMPVPFEEGSFLEWCLDCNATVWCGPSTVEGIMRRRPLSRIRYSCLACLRVRADGNPLDVRILPEQIEAIRAHEEGR